MPERSFFVECAGDFPGMPDILTRKNLSRQGGYERNSGRRETGGLRLFDDEEVKQHDHTEDNAVNAEGGEAVLFDVAHEEFDHHNRNKICYYTSYYKYSKLCTGK